MQWSMRINSGDGWMVFFTNVSSFIYKQSSIQSYEEKLMSQNGI